MAVPVALGAAARSALSGLLLDAWQEAKPGLGKLLTDPAGTLARVGDTLVWSGPSGSKVIGGLETLAESQGRIESAVANIESAQIALQDTLGVVQTVSIATLGLTSLQGVFMVWRFEAIHSLLKRMAGTLRDVDDKLDATHTAHLKSSVQYLREYDTGPGDRGKLDEGLKEARRATNIYSVLATKEVNGPARLPVLYCRGRLYALSLLAELRCMLSADNTADALDRVNEEINSFRTVATACFEQTLGSDPERYLRSCYQPAGVSLDLLTSVYQQAKQIGIVSQPDVKNANEMFEHFRPRFNRGRGVLGRLFGSKVEDELRKLRYLLACLEDTFKIEGLRLLISDLRERNGSSAELLADLRQWRDRQATQERAGESPAVFAYPL